MQLSYVHTHVHGSHMHACNTSKEQIMVGEIKFRACVLEEEGYKCFLHAIMWAAN